MKPNLGALKQIVATQFMPGAAAAQYTCPQAAGSSVAVVKAIIFANTDTVSRTFTVHNVPSGGSPATSNQIFSAVPIPANTTWIGRYEEGCLVIPGGGSLQAFADVANRVTLTVSGEEFL